VLGATIGALIDALTVSVAVVRERAVAQGQLPVRRCRVGDLGVHLRSNDIPEHGAGLTLQYFGDATATGRLTQASQTEDQRSRKSPLRSAQPMRQLKKKRLNAKNVGHSVATTKSSSGKHSTSWPRQTICRSRPSQRSPPPTLPLTCSNALFDIPEHLVRYARSVGTTVALIVEGLLI
jgi:hypothetical protein